MKKSIIYKLSPFNNETNMSAIEYTIKKVLAFILLYCISAVVGEGIIIGILYGMGYDPLHGVMPTGQIAELLPFYGYIIFSILTLLYCRFIEKQTGESVKATRGVMDYFVGTMIAIMLLFIIVGISCALGSIKFVEFEMNIDVKSLLLWILAFVIQGATEEIMCRGFLLNSLKKKISVPVAIMISSTAFAFPHLLSLVEADFVYVIVGIINLYLISIIFSMLVLWRANIWIACGLHSVWNFILYVIMGLNLSGSETASRGVMQFSVKDFSVLNGAEYGIEASIITTIVLGIVALILVVRWKGRMEKNGI